MQRTNRASRSRLAGLLTGAAVAAAVGATGAIIFAGDPVGAAPSTHKTVTITFTDAGPSPSAVQLSSGDAVTFVNHLTQSGQLPVGNLLAQVQSAGVTVQNAATGAIKLPNLNDSKTLTYTGPLAVKYTATYTMSLLPLLNILGVNLLPSTTTSTKAGTIDVAAAPQVAPAQQNPGSGSSGQQPAAGSGGQRPAAGGATVGSGTHPGSGGVLPQAPHPGVASRVVPHGSGTGSTGGSATNARPQTPLGTDQDQQSSGLPQLSGNGGPTQVALTDTSSRTGLGLPAIVAVVLLSVVTAALVRTLITQRRAVLA